MMVIMIAMRERERERERELITLRGHAWLLGYIKKVRKASQKNFHFPKIKPEPGFLGFIFPSYLCIGREMLLYEQVILVSCQLAKITGTIFLSHLKILSLISFSLSSSVLYLTYQHKTTLSLSLSQINLIEYLYYYMRWATSPE